MVDTELLKQGIVQFSKEQDRESKLLPDFLCPEQTFQNKPSIDACELFDDEPKSKQIPKRAKRSS